MHGAFRSGVQKTKWGINGVIKALHSLFDEYPPTRENYQNITGSKFFFHRLSVDTAGLKTRKLQTELLRFGPTLLIM